MRDPVSRNSAVEEFQTQAMILVTIVGIMWGLEIIDVVFLRNHLNQLGIHPRRLSGLLGIPLAPFLHGGFRHLIANTVPLVTLGWLVMLRRTEDFWWVSIISVVVGGLGVWLIGGTGTVHIGASGLVFGYLGFLLLRGYFERSASSILFSIMIFCLYGGLVWGILPWQQRGISWEAHLFGFLGGVLAARLLARPVR
ncbi:MAG: rhomboid family intramembrane serine protease [Prochlorotrichaceae cyanobacterium]|jgi:membrane associated rhomboid family serine protease